MTWQIAVYLFTSAFVGWKAGDLADSLSPGLRRHVLCLGLIGLWGVFGYWWLLASTKSDPAVAQCVEISVGQSKVCPNPVHMLDKYGVCRCPPLRPANN